MAQLPPTNQVILTGEVTEEPTIHYLAPDFPEVHLRLKTEEQARIHQQASRGTTPTASTPASPTFDATAYPPTEDEDPLS